MLSVSEMARNFVSIHIGKQISVFKLIHKARAVARTILTSVLLNNIN